MTTANVNLWGVHVGTVAFTQGERAARFEYTPGFIASGIQLAPIHMPLSAQVYSFPELPSSSFHGLPGLLADSLPDKFGNAVIDAWLSAQGRPAQSLDPVERLCYTGTRGMGALEFEPVIGPRSGKATAIQVDKLTELATQVLQQREHVAFAADANAMEQIIRVGTSAGGARAKAVVCINERTGEIRSGQVDAGHGYEHWILKFDGVSGNRDKEQDDMPSYTVVEYAYHLMACAAGIQMTECRLYEEGGRRHFLTRRFDRVRGTGEKIHMLTLGALAHFDFNSAGSNSYEQAAQMAYRLGLGQDQVEQLFRRMVFNVVARNQDDHVKNIAFLMDKQGSWSLAPAYDITYAFNPGGFWTGCHQMTINGKRSEINREDCLATAQHMNIKPVRAHAIIDEVCSAVAGWSQYAERAQLPAATAKRLQDAFVDLA